MTLAVENFQQGSVQFSTFNGPGSISSATGGHPITTSGTNRWLVWIFMTGRSQTSGNHTFSPVVTLTASGLTPVHLHSYTFNPTIAGNDPSFPEGNMAVDIWYAPASAQLTNQAWSTVTGDTFVNNQVCFQFAVSGLPNIAAVDTTTPVITFDFSGSSTHPETSGVSTANAALVLAMFVMKNGGFTQNAEPGYTLVSQDAGGHSSSNWKCWLHRLVEGAAITNKIIGDSSGSTSNWWSIAIAIGSADTSGDASASGVTLTDTVSLSTVGTADAYVPVPGQTLTVTSSLPTIGVPTAQAIDGSAIYEVILGVEASTIYQTSDYDSIWGRGERVVNGLIDVGFYGFDTVGFWDSAFNDRYSIGAGDGPSVSGTFNAGDALWFEFNGGQKIDLRGFKLVGNENIATDWFFKFVGGLSAGVIETTPYGKEFDTASRQQGPNNDPLTASLVSSEYPMTPRIFVPYSHYEFVYDSGTQSTSRFCNEIWLKVAHSNLDGGDRRPTNGQPAKQVLFTMSSHWSSAGDPQDLLFDGIPRVAGVSKTTATIGTAANSSNPVSTVGAWLQFVFPRPVIMNHFMLVSQGNAEVYSGGLPTRFGTWHWEYSLNSGGTWTAIGDPWSFSENVQYMVAPRDGSQFALGPIGTDGKGATHWRMVLDAGPAFGAGNTLWQAMFDLIDVTGQAPPLTIAFSDDTDGVPATPTIGGPGSPYVIAFTDGTDDKLTATVVNTPNAVLVIAFDDGGTFDTWSDIFPSVVVQSILIATGRV